MIYLRDKKQLKIKLFCGIFVHTYPAIFVESGRKNRRNYETRKTVHRSNRAAIFVSFKTGKAEWGCMKKRCAEESLGTVKAIGREKIRKAALGHSVQTEML